MRPMARPTPATPDPHSPLAGIGLKPAHYREALACRARGFWVEAHPENYMTPGGPRHDWLAAIGRAHPLSFHGVGLSLGGAERPDPGHLRALAALCARHQPFMVSEHLAWCVHGGVYFGDLLPLPYTRAALDRFCAHVDETQEALGRAILIENPALYVTLNGEMGEAEFLTETVRRTGCGLLVDVNNVHVTAVNLGRDPIAFLDALPAGAVGEIHIAGHEADTGGSGLLIDTHGAPVADPVWALYRQALERFGPVPTLVERDNAVPPFAELMAERDRAAAMMRRARMKRDREAALHV
jgi:uncharacterized protein (UPF0276 family)